MRIFAIIMMVTLNAVAMKAKTLIVYYSYTNNVERIVEALNLQIDADILEIESAEKDLDYAANNYALGTQLLNRIRSNPNDASSYPAIDPVDVNMDDYDMVIIACPLWWSQMAAPFQTFLFHYGPQMAGKRIGVIVSSASSGISGVVADARRLIPQGIFMEPNLWIRSLQTSDASSLISTWLSDIHYDNLNLAIGSTLDNDDLNIVVSDGVLTVNGSFDMLSIYTVSGNKVIETSYDQIFISALASGIYIVRVNKGNRAVVRNIDIR